MGAANGSRDRRGRLAHCGDCGGPTFCGRCMGACLRFRGARPRSPVRVITMAQSERERERDVAARRLDLEAAREGR